MAQIKSFQVRFTHGQTTNEPVENINQLDEIIRVYGVERIAKISFYYYTSNNSFHNLILQNEDNTFTVEFNNQDQMYLEEKMDDYNEMLDVLQRTQNLENTLIPLIMDPFSN